MQTPEEIQAMRDDVAAMRAELNFADGPARRSVSKPRPRSTARSSRALHCQRSPSLATLGDTLPDGLASLSDFFAAMIAEAEAAGAPGQPAADEGEP